MKKLVYLLALALFSCNEQHKAPTQANAADTVQQVFAHHGKARLPAAQLRPAKDNSKHYATADTVFIATETGETLKYAKDRFNQIMDDHPEFFNDFITDPDQTYYRHASDVTFNSEAGQDGYYVLYAHFLKQKNGDRRYAQQRKKLIAIYTNINGLFAHFQHGRTYFGHQHARISGYAEFSVYLLSKTGHEAEKTYDITQQKSLYIESLRQLVTDENKIDFSVSETEKHQAVKKLNSIIDDLARLITDIFYLRQAQEFHYSHYEYYQ